MRFLRMVFALYHDFFSLLNPHYISGQGEVFGLISNYFAPEKYNSCVPVSECKKGYAETACSMKTTKSTKPPVRFKGWKGER